MIWTRFLQFWFPEVATSAPTDDQSRVHTRILIADGVGGLHLCTRGLQHAVAGHPLDAVVEAVPWSHGPGRWWRDLTDTRNQERWSHHVANRVLDLRRGTEPLRAIHLVGKSGGCQIILNALEMLPPASVDSAVLIAPAIHPRRDLQPALVALRQSLHVFWSPLDVFILGLGTCLFGTADRKRGVAAGLIGFQANHRENAPLKAKLHQVRWRPTMARTGYLGGHVGPDLPWFHRAYVLPLFQAGTPAPCHAPSENGDPGLG